MHHPAASHAPPIRNELNVARIESGEDTRTTVMIKNIPNKMSDTDLLTYIHRVVPRRIDFMYLRMDFQNGDPACFRDERSNLRVLFQVAMLAMPL
jgi:hypothetical protein